MFLYQSWNMRCEYEPEALLHSFSEWRMSCRHSTCNRRTQRSHQKKQPHKQALSPYVQQKKNENGCIFLVHQIAPLLERWTTCQASRVVEVSRSENVIHACMCMHAFTYKCVHVHVFWVRMHVQECSCMCIQVNMLGTGLQRCSLSSSNVNPKSLPPPTPKSGPLYQCKFQCV